MLAKEFKTLAQDSYREMMMARHCGLISIAGRMHDDATDNFKRRYELKSSTKSHSAVSTARDVTIEKVDIEWKQKYWIVSTGTEFTDGINKRFVWENLWISHPSFLEEEFEHIKKPLVKRQNVIEHIRAKCSDDEFLQQHEKIVDQIFKRGATLNDPKLRLSAFKSKGLRLDLNNSEVAAQQVQEYVSKFPLESKFSLKENETAQIFFNFSKP